MVLDESERTIVRPNEMDQNGPQLVGEQMSSEPVLTMSVPAAGKRYFDLGRNASYEAARRGDIPTIRIGKLLRVPIVALDRKLEEAGAK
jgi:hypothetical protein